MKSAAVDLQCSDAGASEVVQHLYQIFFPCNVQSYQLSSVAFACDGFSRFQQFIINYTLLVPQYAQHITLDQPYASAHISRF